MQELEFPKRGENKYNCLPFSRRSFYQFYVLKYDGVIENIQLSVTGIE